MEISRIEAVSPGNIDWRRLTAKEIIKYKNEGLEVPDIYLQWAKEFITEIDTKDVDNTTYDMANPANNQNQTLNEEQKIEENTQADTDNSVTDATDENKAKEKREELENSGASILSQAVSFTGDSNAAKKEVQESQAGIKDIETQSVNEIASLENYMNELLSRAEAAQKEMKTEIANVNSNKNDATAIGKINDLNQQLQQYGLEGQSVLSTSEGDFNVYEATLNEQSGIIINAQDFGVETVDIGKEVIRQALIKPPLTSLLHLVIGGIATVSGISAQNASQATQELQAQATSTNDSNKSKIGELKNKTEEITGVAGADKTQNSDNEDETAEQTETQQQPADSPSANLDQILQAKIRKGEIEG